MIIGIDPGKTTGIFALSDDPGRPPTVNERDAYWVMDQLDWLLQSAKADENVYVVCERYTQQSTKLTPQYDALEVIGVVRWLCHRWGADLTLQSRSQKSIITSFMLKDIGWWTSGTRGHVNDAARHVLIYLATRDPNHPLVRRTIGTIAAIG